MTTITTVQARDQFADIVNRTAYGKERVVLTRRGRQLAAIIPIEDLLLLQELENTLDLEQAEAAIAEAKKKGTTPWEALKEELGL